MLSRIFSPKEHWNINKYGITTLTVCILVILSLSLYINYLTLVSYPGVKDYGSFYDSAQAFLRGDNPYSEQYANIFRPEIDGVAVVSPNLNPPFFLLFSSLYTIFNLVTGFRVWQITSFLITLLSIFLLWRYFELNNYKWKLLLIICSAGLFSTINLGQIYAPLLLVVTLAYIFIHQKRDIHAGILLGLLCSIKPNFSVLILLFLIMKENKIVLGMIGSMAFCLLIPLLFMDIQIYVTWLDTITQYDGYIIPGNITFIGLTTGIGFSQVGYFLSILLILFTGFFARKFSVTGIDLLSLGIISILLCSPITWVGYTLLLIPYFLITPWNKFDWVAAIIFTFPSHIMYIKASESSLGYITWGWLYGYALVLVMIGYSGKLAYSEQFPKEFNKELNTKSE
jgi:hypothetical protein